MQLATRMAGGIAQLSVLYRSPHSGQRAGTGFGMAATLQCGHLTSMGDPQIRHVRSSQCGLGSALQFGLLQMTACRPTRWRASLARTMQFLPASKRSSVRVALSKEPVASDRGDTANKDGTRPQPAKAACVTRQTRSSPVRGCRENSVRATARPRLSSADARAFSESPPSSRAKPHSASVGGSTISAAGRCWRTSSRGGTVHRQTQPISDSQGTTVAGSPVASQIASAVCRHRRAGLEYRCVNPTPLSRSERAAACRRPSAVRLGFGSNDAPCP